MNINEFLKRVYEANPDGWMPELSTASKTPSVGPFWRECDITLAERLRPVLPDSLPEPPEEAFLYGPDRGGFPLGFGRNICALEGVEVMCRHTARCLHNWFTIGLCSGRCHADDFFVVVMEDPNARAILEANGLWPGYDNGEYWCPNAKPGTDAYARKCYVREGLIEFVERQGPDLEVVPKDAPDAKRDEWVTLDKAGAEFLDDSDERMVWVPLDWDAIALRIIKHGPATVRIRRRDGGGL